MWAVDDKHIALSSTARFPAIGEEDREHCRG